MTDMPPLFAAAGLHARALDRSEVPAVQAFFDANPEYFLIVNGRRPRPDEAQVEFDERPPPHLSFRDRWFAGLFDDAGALQGVVVLLSDLVLPGCWHLALFIVSTALHGSGRAGAVYGAMEHWARAAGAAWLRLGVVAGNARAEAFWQRQGFVEVRRRLGVDTGGRTNDVRVMIKPLAGGQAADYLRQVPRDQPGSLLD